MNTEIARTGRLDSEENPRKPPALLFSGPNRPKGLRVSGGATAEENRSPVGNTPLEL